MNTDGPRIVTNGLIQCLDAVDKNSYPGSGATWYDLSGNNNNATLINTPTYNGGSFTFNKDGTFGQYISLGINTSADLPNSLSIGLWINLLSSGNSWIVSSMDDSTQNLGEFGFYNGVIGGISSAAFLMWTADDVYSIARGTTLTSDIWHYVVGTFDSGDSTIKTYINGELAATTVSPSSKSNLSNNFNVLTTGYSSIYYTGSVGAIYVHNRVLSAGEILQNYKSLKTRFGKS